MKTFKRLVLAAGVSLLMAGASSAQDIYVKNRLYKGPVSTSGSSLMVNAESFLKALKVSDYSIGEGSIAVAGQTIPLQGDSMVSLSELKKALGLRVIENRQLGTVDVYQGTAKRSTASSGGGTMKEIDNGPPVVKAPQATPGGAIALEDSLARGRKNIVYFYADW